MRIRHYFPKIRRSSIARRSFLRMRGYKKCPQGMHVHHIVPLWAHGSDSPGNMTLVPKRSHHFFTRIQHKLFGSRRYWKAYRSSYPTAVMPTGRKNEKPRPCTCTLPDFHLVSQHYGLSSKSNLERLGNYAVKIMRKIANVSRKQDPCTIIANIWVAKSCKDINWREVLKEWKIRGSTIKYIRGW